jgi:predicted nucleotidyltransferase
MRSPLPTIALELGADERTLRRAVGRGAVHCSRATPRQLEFAPGELDYLRTHWELLSSLSRALRTEPNVGLAVLYGSAARGDDRADSDVDLLVGLRNSAPSAATALAMRLGDALERDVDVARLDRVRTQAPFLLVQALDEGRVLVDREAEWPKLQSRRDRFVRAARKAIDQNRREAAASLDMLLADA